ncbi:uncharacterized protein EV154DRAFT_560857 [Mucor mucedo]|uniref:uncharacterized protein n=1 Tax=Mucor mucedo TaxID=29922 RepID=UPI00221E7BFA|nr:uncharacterized protein EV154DRAFT_560857 [Mucor mucedo]KAI7893827.1 hypothetical protein EV154DRAFT_560857 [Mucor mucedo]
MSTDTLDPPPPPPPGGETVPTNGNPQHGYFSRKCKIYTFLRNNYRSYKQLFREIAETHSRIRKDSFDFALFLCLNYLTNEQLRMQESTMNSSVRLREISTAMVVYNLHLGNLSNGLRDILAVFPTENIQQMEIARQIFMREAASLQNQTLRLDNINAIINEVLEIDITIDTANTNLLQIILILKQELNRIDDAVVRTSTTVGTFEGVYEMYLPNLTQRLNLLLPQFEHVARLTIDTIVEHRNTI